MADITPPEPSRSDDPTVPPPLADATPPIPSASTSTSLTPPSLEPALASSTSTTGLTPLASGFVHKHSLRPGNGPPPPDKASVTVHYVGYCGGVEFDSSYARGEPYTFRLGAGLVMRGWDAAVASMAVGEVSRFVVQPRYAYAERGFTITEKGQAITSAQRGQRATPPPASPSSTPPSPFVIPPNAPLVFLIELLRYSHVQKATEDGGVLKKILRHGEGAQRPNDGARCTLRWRARLPGAAAWFTSHWDEDVQLTIGHDARALMGLEDGVRNMYALEHALFTLRPDYAYGDAGSEALAVPPAATVEVEVELRAFEKGVETWQLGDEEKIAWMALWKAKANESFEAGDVVRAIRKYLKVIEVFQYDAHLSADQRRRVYELKVACHANLAMAKTRQGRASDVFKHTNEALRMDPDHVKSLYRRGVAYANMHDDDNALVDLTRALRLEPGNVAIELELSAVQQRVRAAQERERNAFKGAFSSATRPITEDEGKAQMSSSPAVPVSAPSREQHNVARKQDTTVQQVSMRLSGRCVVPTTAPP